MFKIEWDAFTCPFTWYASFTHWSIKYSFAVCIGFERDHSISFHHKMTNVYGWMKSQLQKRTILQAEHFFSAFAVPHVLQFSASSAANLCPLTAEERMLRAVGLSPCYTQQHPNTGSTCDNCHNSIQYISARCNTALKKVY